MNSKGWRCFHCDEQFTNRAEAALHFGTGQLHSPACQIDIAEYRAMEARMHSYNEEDADIHRQMARMHTEHRLALQREGEKGYARGLVDAAKQQQAEQAPVAWQNFDGEGGHDYTDDEETAEYWKQHNGEKYANWLVPLYASPERRVKALIEALERIAAIEDEQHGGDWDEIELARVYAEEALNEYNQGSK